MTSIRSLVVLCALGVAWAPGSLRAEMAGEMQAAPRAREIQVVPQEGSNVVVRDVRDAGDTVSGTVENRGPHPVQNVRLAISHVWLWDNEMHPGDDDFSRTDYYTVPGEVPAGGRSTFSLRPSTPLREGSGGHFVNDVNVTSFDMVVPAGSGSPTAGTRGVEPSPRPLEREMPRTTAEPVPEPPGDY